MPSPGRYPSSWSSVSATLNDHVHMGRVPPSDTVKPQVRAYAGPPKRGHFYRSSTGRWRVTVGPVGPALLRTHD